MGVNQGAELHQNRRLAYQRLLRALEHARSRLAVAVAAEAKWTPLGRWGQYLEIGERLRRCLRELRLDQDSEMRFRNLPAWVLIERLAPLVKMENGRGDAQRISGQLSEILGTIDAHRLGK